MRKDIAKSILFGVSVGDALGVPVEFRTREEISINPVDDLRGMGTYFLPPGTWSDDSSLTLCLAEVLTKGYSLTAIANNFIKWYREGYWSATKKIFDVGVATMEAIERLEMGVTPQEAGGKDEYDNGNGSLMRILPLLVYIHDLPIEKRFQFTQEVSAITHGHIRSIIACFYYLEFARKIIKGEDKFQAYKALQKEVTSFCEAQGFPTDEIALYDRLLKGEIQHLKDKEISSGGYVLHTLEASIWCILTTESYSEAVLKAVNLGDDTDTTGAVTGGLAALIYGFDNIPEKWVENIVASKDIMELANNLQAAI